MNKKIKVIELFELIFNNKQIPQKILYDNEEYVFNGESFVCCDHDTTSLLSEYNKSRLIEFLNDEVEILEDNTEEIEEIKGWGLATDYKDFETINHTLDRFGNKINELVKIINEMRKDKNND